MMNHSDGWMSGWVDGGMGPWSIIGLAVVVLLAALIALILKK